MNRTQLEKLLADIAVRNFNIETLETRKSDSLDFSEVAVWQIKKALQEAFEAGQKSNNC